MDIGNIAEVINEFKVCYTEWCVINYQGYYDSTIRYPYCFPKKLPKETVYWRERPYKYDIGKILNGDVRRGYGELSFPTKPWLEFEAQTNIVTIFGFLPKKNALPLAKRIMYSNYQKSRKEINDYFTSCGIKSHFVNVENNSAYLLVVYANRNVFIAAGWQNEFDSRVKKEVEDKNKILNCILDNKEKIISFYKSQFVSGLNNISNFIKYEKKCSYWVNDKCVCFEKWSSDDSDEVFVFNRYGYRNLISCDEVISLGTAVFCHLYKISPENLDRNTLCWTEMLFGTLEKFFIGPPKFHKLDEQKNIEYNDFY